MDRRQNQEAAKYALALKSLNVADKHYKNEDFGKAFANFLLVLKLAPEWKTDVEHNFIVTLQHWTDTLESLSRVSDLFRCYEQASEVLPDNEMIFNDMGSSLFRLGFKDEAASCFRKALRINPGFLDAKDNLQNVLSALIERWHFRMLNDKVRNHAFQSAIRKAIQDGHDTVLDIGAGTGILSMLAIQSGAKHVYACEMSKTTYEMAKDVLTTNRMSDKVTLLHTSSKDIVIPKDIPQRVSLVVTETVDSGLLGENIIQTLSHAWKRLLIEDNTGNKLKPQVIPAGATVFAQVIECQELRKQHRVIVDAVDDIDLTCCDIISPCMMGQCNDGDATISVEPYSSEILQRVHGGYTPITGEFQTINFDFNNPQLVQSCEPGGPVREYAVPAIATGRVDAIVCWFHLHLDKDTSISTSPDGDSCWEQAVFPVHPSHCKPGVGYISKGDCITIQGACINNTLNFKIVRIESSQSCHTTVGSPTSLDKSGHKIEGKHCNKSSTSKLPDTKLVSASGDSVRTDKSDSQPEADHSVKVFSVTSEEIAAINHVKFQDLWCQVVRNEVVNRRKQTQKGVAQNEEATNETAEACSDVVIMDMTSGLSLAGVHAAKAGATKVITTNQSQKSQQALQHIAKCNGIAEVVLVYGEGEDDEMVDVLVTDVIDVTGILKQRVLEDIAFAKSTILKPGGCVCPYGLTIYAVCIESCTLQQESGVIDNDRTLGLHIAPFMNIFQTSTHQEIDLSTLPHRRLTEPFKLFELDFDAPINPESDTLPPFLENYSSLHIPVCESGNVTAIPYWFEIHLDKKYSISTLDEEPHWRQAAIIINDSMSVVKDEIVCIKGKLQNSCLDIELNHGQISEESNSTV
ncbi:protein arginine N-methyltransferase 9-like [Saccoglossus kowalevskii]|uniref:Uncharacterized protein n=1 Tax=Saccoglossus kowalevskii TaxID=10224 RepID=A0ABM0GX97_SACKO|nr:PREDICTED: putative protein arginine N-methyltransferase 10-like [Saccoglossus kowalevskii]